MKIIELLNKIANGEEVPEKINYNGILYTYNEGIDYENQNGGFLMSGRVCICPEHLNEEIEIIEEPQEHKIPEKLIIGVNECDEIHINNEIYGKRQVRVVADKVNEILDYLEGIE